MTKYKKIAALKSEITKKFHFIFYLAILSNTDYDMVGLVLKINKAFKKMLLRNGRAREKKSIRSVFSSYKL